MIDPKKVARLKRLIEMTDSFTQIVAIEKKLNERLDTEIAGEKEQLNDLVKDFQEVINKAKSEMSSTFSGVRQKTVEAIDRLISRSDVNKKLQGRLNEADALFARIDEKLSKVRDGKDADEKTIVEAVLSRIKPPKDGKRGDKGEKGDSGKDGESFDPEEFIKLRSELFEKISEEVGRIRRRGGAIGDASVLQSIQRLGLLTGTNISLDTTNFDNNLSSADNTVQKALETLDELTAGGGSAADDTPYDATSWNANTDAATKNAIRDKIETMDTAIGSNTTHRTNVDAINGLVKGNGAGSYSAVTDSSSNWNTAYSHSQVTSGNPHNVTLADVGGTTDHGTLTGLSDDDHTQYLLVAGSRAMTGRLDLFDDSGGGTNAQLKFLATGFTPVNMYMRNSILTIGTSTGTTNRILGLSTAGITNYFAFQPSADNTIDNGTSSLRYKDVYIAGSLKDATNSITVAQADSTRTRYFNYRVLAKDASCGVSTGFGGDLEIPVTGTITEIGAYVDTAGTTGTMTVDVNKNGTTLMTTNKVTIDTAEKSSRTAATAPALTTTSITAGDLITVDIDAIHTTAAKGLTVRFAIKV